MGCPFSLYSMSKSQGFQRTTFLHQVENPHKTPHPPWLFRNELLLDPKADPSLPQSVLLHAILLFHCLTCLLAWSATKLHDHHGIMRRDREAPPIRRCSKLARKLWISRFLKSSSATGQMQKNHGVPATAHLSAQQQQYRLRDLDSPWTLDCAPSQF